MATRFARATGDCFLLLLRDPPPDLRPDDDPRFEAPLRAAPPDDLRPDDLRAPPFRDAPPDDLRDADFRDEDLPAPDFRPLDFRLDPPPRLPADFFEAPLREELPPLFLRAPDLRDPPLRDPPRDDFLLDAMNSLLVRWWCCDE